MLTHKDYIAGRCSFDDYYGEIVDAAGISYSSDSDLMARVRRALAGGDKHLNTIPLDTWDIIAAGQLHATIHALAARGDSWSMAVGVCIAKRAARMSAEK